MSDGRAAAVAAPPSQLTNEILLKRLEGGVLVSAAADVHKSERGYDATLLGYIDYDAAADRISRRVPSGSRPDQSSRFCICF